MSTSVNVRDDLCVSLINTYAELNVPNYGVDLDDMPENMDFAEVNYARMTANDSVSDMTCTYINVYRLHMYIFIPIHMHYIINVSMYSIQYTYSIIVYVCMNIYTYIICIYTYNNISCIIYVCIRPTYVRMYTVPTKYMCNPNVYIHATYSPSV